jgi:hypothetical protein
MYFYVIHTEFNRGIHPPAALALGGHLIIDTKSTYIARIFRPMLDTMDHHGHGQKSYDVNEAKKLKIRTGFKLKLTDNAPRTSDIPLVYLEIR